MTPEDIVSRLKVAATSAATRLNGLWRHGVESWREAWARLQAVPGVDDSAEPLELLSENAPRLPATSDRAFRIGLVVVSLSVVSALATYLILSNLTPIAPSDEAEQSKKIRFLSIGRLLGEAIRRIHNSDSVSSLFV